MNAEHLSDLELDRLRISQERPPVHLDSCPRCQGRFEALLKAQDEFRARYSEGALIGDLQQRMDAKKPRRWIALWVPALAAAAALAAVVVLVPGPQSIRPKGDGVLLEVFVLQPEGGRAPLEGPIAPGSRLAVRLAPKQRSAVRLLWGSEPRSTRGASAGPGPDDRPKVWAALYPDERAPSWMLAEPAWLEREVVLDDAREDEELAVVACTESVDHRGAAAMLDGRVRPDCTIARVRIEKR